MNQTLQDWAQGKLTRLAGGGPADAHGTGPKLAAGPTSGKAARIFPESLVVDFREAWALQHRTFVFLHAYRCGVRFAGGIRSPNDPEQVVIGAVELPPFGKDDHEVALLQVSSLKDGGELARVFLDLAARAGAYLPRDVVSSLRQSLTTSAPACLWCLLMLQDRLTRGQRSWEDYLREQRAAEARFVRENLLDVSEDELGRHITISNNPFFESLDLMERMNAAQKPSGEPEGTSNSPKKRGGGRTSSPKILRRNKRIIKALKEGASHDDVATRFDVSVGSSRRIKSDAKKRGEL